MSKDELKVLIRIYKFELDEKQRKLVNLLRFEQALLNRKALLEERFKQEEATANENPLTALTFGAYVDWHVKENKRLDHALAENGEEIVLMREEIRESYLELKTVEITQENREKRQLDELKRKINNILDEIGLNSHRRKQYTKTEKKDS